MKLYDLLSMGQNKVFYLKSPNCHPWGNHRGNREGTIDGLYIPIIQVNWIRYIASIIHSIIELMKTQTIRIGVALSHCQLYECQV